MMMELNLQLVIWVHPEYGDAFHHVVQRLGWTKAEVSEISRLAPNILSWPVRISLDESVLVKVGHSIRNLPSDAWAIAFVKDPGTWLRKNLAQLRGQIVIDEHVAAALHVQVHCDHPMHRELREQHLGLWSLREFQEPKPEDPGEALRKMRNVARLREYGLESQSIGVRLPIGKSPADYAATAYADVPDGSDEHSGIGGRHVLLFHSAMKCHRHPFAANGGDPPPMKRGSEETPEPSAFVFLNATAAEVQYYSVNRIKNNLIDHVLNGRISVEQVIGGPDHHVRYRPDSEER
jgi:hypothetical protein